MAASAPAKRFILVGLDGVGMESMLHMVEAGYMPNVGRLIKRGVHREMWGVLPTLTPPGWTTLATGAWPGTHQVMDFNIRALGKPLDQTEWGINTRLCKAEYLWNTVERGGRVPVLVKYEMSWPPTISRGVQVEGTGPGISNHAQIAGYHLFAVGREVGQTAASTDSAAVDPSALREAQRFEPITLHGVADTGSGAGTGSGWRNLPESARQPLAAELVIRPLHRSHAFMRRSGIGVPKSYYALIYATGSRSGTGTPEAGYDRVRITRSRDGADRLFEQDLRAGEWTAYAADRFRIGDSDIAGHVRMKCVELSPDAGRFELFVPQIWPLDGFTYPNAVAAELLEHVGPFLQNPGRDALGVIDDDTYFELVEHHLQTLAETAIHLCSTRPDWGGLFTQTHVPDYANHFYMADADAVSGQPAERVERCFQGMARSYAACDRWIGRLCEALLDEHTVICIVADHGGTPTSYPMVEVADVLEQTGFLVYTDDGNGGRVVDWTRTTAAPVGNVNIYVNLKGREPTGSVEPADYEQVRRDIIHALNGYREPESGYCPFVFALRREDAEVANLWGELVGDVVYATLPEFTGAHGPQLPSARLGWGSQHTCFVMAGAGIKEGVHLQQQVRQVDVAPTLAYVTGLPRPRDAEGGVVAEALTDPDWYL